VVSNYNYIDSLSVKSDERDGGRSTWYSGTDSRRRLLYVIEYRWLVGCV